MSYRFRNILFWIFVVIFLITTFFVSMYAAGYRVNLSWPINFNQVLQKTGLIIIKTEPAGATIYLDGKQQEAPYKKYLGQDTFLSTPNRLKNLFPKEYKLRLELDGYWPWEKDIKVNPGQSIYLDNIILFRKNLPTLVKATGVQNIKISPDGNYLLLDSDKEILDLSTEQAAEITLTDDWNKTDYPPVISSDRNIKFVAQIDKNNLIYATDFEIFAFDLSLSQKTLITRLSQKINGLLWQSDGFIIYSNNKGINLIDLNNEQKNTAIIELDKLNSLQLSKNGRIIYFTASINNSEGLYKLLIK